MQLHTWTDRQVLHEINTGDNKPFKSAPYTIPIAYLHKVREELRKLLEANIIEISKSQWASPLITVLKKDGGIRLLGDYLRLNAITESDPYYYS